MLVTQKTYNLYFSITVTFTLAHLKKTRAVATNESYQGSKKKTKYG